MNYCGPLHSYGFAPILRLRTDLRYVVLAFPLHLFLEKILIVYILDHLVLSLRVELWVRDRFFFVRDSHTQVLDPVD